jgi:NAD(P)-dependent dehydrogenase (short-subunit alcohol dehydrogenase family)
MLDQLTNDVCYIVTFSIIEKIDEALMKVIVIGGTGTLGKAVVGELKERHTVVVVAREHGDIQVDISNSQSIQTMYETIGKFDALVATTGTVHFGEFTKLTPKEHMIGINSKLMGQVSLVHQGLQYINDQGSFTLTSGLLSDDPIRYGCSASMINAAINGFVQGAAVEMPRGIRINAVSPTVVTESLAQYGVYFRGFESVDASKVALAFSKSVEGIQTGKVYRAGW